MMVMLMAVLVRVIKLVKVQIDLGHQSCMGRVRTQLQNTFQCKNTNLGRPCILNKEKDTLSLTHIGEHVNILVVTTLLSYHGEVFTMLVAMESKFVSFCLDNYSAHLGNCPKAIIEIRTSLRDNENRKQDEDNIVVTNDGEYAGWRISRAQSPNLESHVVLGKSSLGGCGEEIPSTCEPSCVDWSTLWPGTMSCEFGDKP